MRYLIFFIGLLLSTSCLFGQESIFLSYQQTISPKKDTLAKNTTGFMHVFSPSIMVFMESKYDHKKNYFLNADSIFVITTLSDTKQVYSYKLQTNDSIYIYNPMTGERQSIQPNVLFRDEYNLRKKLKKNKKHNKNHPSSPYDLWEASTSQYKLVLHVSKEVRIPQQPFLYQRINHNGYLINRREWHNKESKNIITFSLDSIIYKSNSIYSQTNTNLPQKELVLSNQHIDIDSVSHDTMVPDIFFQDVYSGEINSLNKYKSNGKYLLIDFWGTWCKPCLASIPDLKEFVSKYKNQVDILSMDYKDTNLDLVKQKIAETGMTWSQGIATVKINELLNPQSHFPGIVLFDDEMNLLYRGDAKKGLANCEKIINPN